MTQRIAVSAGFLKALAGCGLLFATGSVMAQPSPPSFEGHHDTRSREPGASLLSYAWSCGKIERSIEFRPSYRAVSDNNGDPSIAAAWSVDRYVTEGRATDEVNEELSAFVASLTALNYVTGRCFDTEGEVRISGLTAGSDKPVARTFRVR